MDSRDMLIRDAFAKVKEDMTSLSSKVDGLNDNIMSLKEDLDELRNDTATKDMMTACERDLLELRNSSYLKTSVDKQLSRIDSRIDSLSAVIDKREKQMEDVKDIKEMRRQIEGFNAKFLSKAELKKLFDKLNEDLVYVDKRLTEIEEQSYYMDEVEKSFTSKNEFKEQLAGVAGKMKDKTQAIADKVARLEGQVSKIQDEAANLNELGRIEEDMRGLGSRIISREDFDALRTRLDAVEKGGLKEQLSMTQRLEKQLTVLTKKANAMDASLAKMDSELAQIYDLTDKSASKEHLGVIKKELAVMMEGLQSLSKLKQEMNELKKGHKEHRAVTKGIEKKLKPGKVQLLLQRDNPRRGI